MFARIGRLSAARPRRTLLVTLLFLVVAGLFGGPVSGILSSDNGFTTRDSESEQAQRQIERATGQSSADSISVLVTDAAGDVTRQAQVVASELRGIDGIAVVRPPVPSQDGASALVNARTAAAADESDVATATLERFDGARGVHVGGGAVADEQVGSTVSEDLGRAELFAFPLLALLSLLFFRGRATVLPVLVGVTTVLGTFLVLRGVNELYGLSVFALNLVIGAGLGLAIDYTLFLVTRFREELTGGAAVPDAVRTTMTTAGRTVAFSAATVAAAMATLTVFPLNFARSMGLAGASVAVVAALAALLISPALLSLWGRKLLRRDAGADAAHGRWHRLAHAVMRRPGPVAVVTGAVMLAVALPATGVNWTPVDESVVPEDQSARVVSDAVQRDFGGAGDAAVTVALDVPGDEAGEVRALAADVRGLDGVRAVRAQDLGEGTWTLTAAVEGDPAGPRAREVVEEIRDLPTPLDAAVTGPAAGFVDQQATIGSHVLPAVLILAGLTFAVLWLMTGSVILPLKAILMNTLTVGAALAPLVLIYQGGHLEGVLGYTSNGGVEPTDFLVTAAIVFALSTDYGVFLLGRIKEARDGGLGEREAVATGLASTGRVVTAAAILMAVAIGAFSTSSISFIQQIGIATATGVLLDAFVVRTLLVPSLMALLGRWNWWSPRPLRWLHDRVGVSEAAPTA